MAEVNVVMNSLSKPSCSEIEYGPEDPSEDYFLLGGQSVD